MRKLTLNDVCKLIEQKGELKLLSTEYSNSREKLDLLCIKCGNVWSVSFCGLKRGNCIWCSRRPPKTHKDIENIVKLKHGRIIDGTYKNARSRFTVKCGNGHIWDITANNLRSGKWCPDCAGKGKIYIEQCREFATSMNGECLSDSYRNSRTNIKWKCANGHIWESNFSNIKHHKKWCPVCNKRGKNQKRLFEIIKQIYKTKQVFYNFRGFSWLKTSSTGAMEIDIFVADVKLAIEYDGEQHFAPVKHWGGESALCKQKSRDATKNDLIAQHPEDVYTFVRIPYWESIKLENVIKILKDRNAL